MPDHSTLNPNRTLTSLSAQAGDPWALQKIGSLQAASVASSVPDPESPPETVFSMALWDLLKDFQKVEKYPFAEQGLAAGEEQVKRLSFTPPGLIGASPGLQSAARGASVSAVSPTIQGAQAAGQTFQSQLGTFENILGRGQEIAQTVAQERQRQAEELQKERERLSDLKLSVAKAGGDPTLVDPNLSYDENIARIAPVLAAADDSKQFIQNLQLALQLAQITGDASFLGLLLQGQGGPTSLQAPQSAAPSAAPSSTIPQSARTERHNNPIATIVNKSFANVLDRAGVPWSVGDPFTGSDGQTYNTIRFPTFEAGVEGARAILSQTKAIETWYLNHTGQAILNQYGITTGAQFAQADHATQDAIIEGIRQGENKGAVGAATIQATSTAPASVPASTTPTAATTYPDDGISISEIFLANQRTEIDNFIKEKNAQVIKGETTKDTAVQQTKARFPFLSTQDIAFQLAEPSTAANPKVKAILLGLERTRREVDQLFQAYREAAKFGFTGTLGGTVGQIGAEGVGIPRFSIGGFQFPGLLTRLPGVPQNKYVVSYLRGRQNLANTLAQALGLLTPQLGSGGTRSLGTLIQISESDIPKLTDDPAIVLDQFKSLYQKVLDVENSFIKSPDAFVGTTTPEITVAE